MNKCVILSILLMTLNVGAKTTKSKMSDAFNSFLKLQNYVLDEKKFTDKSNHQIIYSELFNMNKIFHEIHSSKELPTFNYSVNAKIISAHLEDTLESFDLNQKYFARNKLKATTSLCISCHMQIKTKASYKVISALKNEQEKFSNDYIKAELLFLARDYAQAEIKYSSYIKDTIKKQKEISKTGVSTSIKNIINSFRKVIALNTRTFFRPKKAIDFINRFDLKELSTMDAKELNSRKEELMYWANKDEINVNQNVDEVMEKYIKGEKNQDNHVNKLVVSGFLKRKLLVETDKKEIAKSLLALSKVERDLSFSYFYSFSESYLMACMDNFSKLEIAKKCYEDYEESIKLGYSGSAGLSIPDSVQKQLKSYKEKVFNK